MILKKIFNCVLIFLISFSIFSCSHNTSTEISLPSSTTSESSRQKILALHGGGELPQDFQNQAGMQSLMSALPNVTFVFADAPEPGNVWIKDPPGGKNQPTTDRPWADNSIDYLDQFVIDNGPFDIILGYSQGCAMALLYLSRSSTTFNKVLLFNGYRPTTHYGLNSTISESAPFTIPSFIFGGQQDPFYFGVSELQVLFENPNILTSSLANHHLPFSTDPTFQEVVNFIIEN